MDLWQSYWLIPLICFFQTLKLMKYIVENGHPNFKLGLIKNSRGIKEATSKFEVDEVYN